ncbi:uncharacterized protein CTRU02_212883 [Colletotrichum truncatum]|uniref:Uncharacterized protein n=1 Tax=Colletotrichum truncatum TaxID=5467 RepID=A0ACC3YJ74_COLTU|nr:uncharacterized protein CTRU02_03207 [Colletotrichum truncatum]KAF6797176.1 hypothetical protein CTRU02_03207 [Colletotrichum truncatum]
MVRGKLVDGVLQPYGVRIMTTYGTDTSKGTEHLGQVGRIRWLRLRMQAGRPETIKYMPPFGLGSEAGCG